MMLLLKRYKDKKKLNNQSKEMKLLKKMILKQSNLFKNLTIEADYNSTNPINNINKIQI